MKKETWKFILQTIASILTAIATTMLNNVYIIAHLKILYYFCNII